jgi:hypothetical protein
MRTGAGYRLFVRVWNAGSAGFLLCRTIRTTETLRANGTADTTEQLIEGCRENEGTEKQPVFLSSPFFFINEKLSKGY